MLTELVWSIIATFIVCEFGQRVNTAFEELNDRIDEFDWYMYPMEIQRIAPIIMAAIQRRVIVQAFGNIVCIRQLFKKVSDCSLRQRIQIINFDLMISGDQHCILILYGSAQIHRLKPKLNHFETENKLHIPVQITLCQCAFYHKSMLPFILLCIQWQLLK